VEASLACSTGVHTAADALKALLVGADVVMLTAALLQHGPEYLGHLETEMVRWMTERDYASVRELRGMRSQIAVVEPAAFERASYVRTLTGFAAEVGEREPWPPTGVGR
jgi:dihydroorotate dehydrogenase (fumarate)